MPEVAMRRTAGGRVFLNAGCGSSYSAEWNNVDLYHGPDVIYHDLRNPLPYPGGVFDAAYSSHALEHLPPDDGRRLLGEMYRCLKAGGVCRIVVPDYERACREYLRWLEAATARPDDTSLRRYRWSVIELVDQFVRTRSGGKMLEALQSGDFDEEYVRERNGEEFAPFYGRAASCGGPADGNGRRRGPLRSALRRLRVGWKGYFHPPKGPAETGELHRWAYDRLSLRLLLEEVGFVDVGVCTFDRSRIPEWERYRLDSAKDGLNPRKPDSLYMEGLRPAGRIPWSST
jgi:predicted SAM-dependent methyltransferase